MADKTCSEPRNKRRPIVPTNHASAYKLNAKTSRVCSVCKVATYLQQGRDLFLAGTDVFLLVPLTNRMFGLENIPSSKSTTN